MTTPWPDPPGTPEPRTEFKWEEPPGPRAHEGNTDWRGIAEALIARPGEWALIKVCTSSMAARNTARNVRISAYVPLRGKTFEAVARMVDDEARVYARHVAGGAS